MTIHTNITSGTAAAPPAGLAEAHFKTALGILETTHADAAQGWTPQRQSQFLAAIADGATVADAAQEAGLSRRSAYAFRRTARGAAFRLGWQAAEILAADSLREDLWDRARHGQTWTVVRDDGERTITTTRHRFDNRLALSMLTRLEARAVDTPDADPVRVAARFDAFLDAVEGAEAAADPAALVADFCPPRPAEPAIGRCESCESAADDNDGRPTVWFDPEDETWMTTFAPPDGYAGQEYGGFWFDDSYSRTLDASEVARIAHFDPEDSLEPPPRELVARRARRDAWFAAATHAARVADVPALLAAREGRAAAAVQ